MQAAIAGAVAVQRSSIKYGYAAKWSSRTATSIAPDLLPDVVASSVRSSCVIRVRFLGFDFLMSVGLSDLVRMQNIDHYSRRRHNTWTRCDQRIENANAEFLCKSEIGVKCSTSVFEPTQTRYFSVFPGGQGKRSSMAGLSHHRLRNTSWKRGWCASWKCTIRICRENAALARICA